MIQTAHIEILLGLKPHALAPAKKPKKPKVVIQRVSLQDLLKESGPMTRTTIQKTLGIDKKQAKEQLWTLIKAGRVRIVQRLVVPDEMGNTAVFGVVDGEL